MWKGCLGETHSRFGLCTITVTKDFASIHQILTEIWWELRVSNIQARTKLYSNDLTQEFKGTLQVIARDYIFEIRAFGFRRAFTCVRAVATELGGEYCTSRTCKIYCWRDNYNDYRSYHTLQLLLLSNGNMENFFPRKGNIVCYYRAKPQLNCKRI
jgi:hypothetical protein